MKLNDKKDSTNLSKEGESEVQSDYQANNDVEKKIPGYITANLYNYRFIREIREVLKENPTDAEKLIWGYLRNKKIGYKIRRQHVIDNFIPDFVCLSKKVVIEIDGGVHLQQQEYDASRTNILNEKGYKVIRFTNDEVFANPMTVATKIKEILDNQETFIKED